MAAFGKAYEGRAPQSGSEEDAATFATLLEAALCEDEVSLETSSSHVARRSKALVSN